jgi:DNA invertase Pin-like site-specific DNA recombinase
MPKIRLYCRVSTEDQNVEQQAEYLENWVGRLPVDEITKEPWTIEKIVKDEESARIPLMERKKFLKTLEESKLGTMFDALGILKLDRLTRNWDDVAAVERHFRANWERCKLKSAMDGEVNLSTAPGRCSFRFFMVINCFEVENMMERQKIGIDRAKDEGKYKGGKKGRRWAKPAN